MKTFFINSDNARTELRRTDIGAFRHILQFLEDGLDSSVSGWDYAVEHDGGVKPLAELSKRERGELHREISLEMTFQVRTPATYQNGSDIDVGWKSLTSELLADIEQHLSLEGMKCAISKVYAQGIQLTSSGWRWVAGAKAQPYHLKWVGLLAYYTELDEGELPDLTKFPLIYKVIAQLRADLDLVEPAWE